MISLNIKKRLFGLVKNIKSKIRETILVDLIVFFSLIFSLALQSLRSLLDSNSRKSFNSSKIEFLVIGSSYSRAFSCIDGVFCLMIFTGKQGFLANKKLKRINAILRVRKILRKITTNPQKIVLILGNDASLAFREKLIDKNLIAANDSVEIEKSHLLLDFIANRYLEMAKVVRSELPSDVYLMNSFPTLCPIETSLNSQLNQRIKKNLLNSCVRFIDNFDYLCNEDSSVIDVEKIASKKYLDSHLSRDTAISLMSRIDKFSSSRNFKSQRLPLFCHKWGVNEIDLTRVWPEPISHPVNSRHSPFVQRTVFADAMLAKLRKLSGRSKIFFVVHDDSYLVFKYLSENASFGSRILFDMPNQSDVEVSNQILELYGVGLERHYTYTSSFPEVFSHFSTVVVDLIASSRSIEEIIQNVVHQLSGVSHNIDVFVFGNPSHSSAALDAGFVRGGDAEFSLCIEQQNGFLLKFVLLVRP